MVNFAEPPRILCGTPRQSPQCVPLVCQKFAENPEFRVGNFAVNLKRETSHAKLKGHENPPLALAKIAVLQCVAAAKVASHSFGTGHCLRNPPGGGGGRLGPRPAPRPNPPPQHQKSFPPAKNELYQKGRKFEAEFTNTNLILLPSAVHLEERLTVSQSVPEPASRQSDRITQFGFFVSGRCGPKQQGGPLS